MRILKLRMRNFRVFDDMDVVLAPGMNLVRGPNESGKSTMVNGLVAGLFEKPASKSASARSMLRWGTEDAPAVEIEFFQNGERYRLAKDWGERSVSLVNLDSGKTWDTQKAVDAKIADFVGFADSAHYLRTACVTHDQMVSLAEDSGGARKLATLLREIVVGGRESRVLEAAVKELTAGVDELKRGMERPASNPGTIRRLADERESLIARQKELSGGVERFERSRERLAVVEEVLREKSPRLDDSKSVLDKNRAVAELEKDIEEARSRFAQADQVKERQAEVERLDDEIESRFSRFLELDPGADEELRKEIEVRRSLGSLREGLAEKADVESVESRRGARWWAGWAFAVAGVLLIVAGAVLGAVVHPALFALAGLGTLGIGAGVWLLLAGVRPPVEVLRLDEGVTRAEDEIARLEEREAEFLRSAGFQDASSFFSEFTSYKKLLAERERAVAGRDALVSGRKGRDAVRDRLEASIDVSAIEGRLDRLRASRLDPVRLESVEREAASLEEEVRQLEKEREGLSFHLEEAGADPEESVAVEERVAWLWDQEQAARKRLRVSSMALDAMTRARELLLASAVPVLSESVARTFSELTGRRYDRVDVQESDLGISVFSSEKGEYIEADDILSTLSKGTVSQLYLSARLQLVDILSGGAMPPLIFDDSFTYFDEDRLERLWLALNRAARDRQVLVLTCTSRYDALAGPETNVIDLPRR